MAKQFSATIFSGSADAGTGIAESEVVDISGYTNVLVQVSSANNGVANILGTSVPNSLASGLPVDTPDAASYYTAAAIVISSAPLWNSASTAIAAKWLKVVFTEDSPAGGAVHIVITGQD